jgi:hypothetical protein
MCESSNAKSVTYKVHKFSSDDVTYQAVREIRAQDHTIPKIEHCLLPNTKMGLLPPDNMIG